MKTAKKGFFRWLKRTPIMEFVWLRGEYSDDGRRHSQLTHEIGCLDAPTILPAGSTYRYLAQEVDGITRFGWPRPTVAHRETGFGRG